VCVYMWLGVPGYVLMSSFNFVSKYVSFSVCVRVCVCVSGLVCMCACLCHLLTLWARMCPLVCVSVRMTHSIFYMCSKRLAPLINSLEGYILVVCSFDWCIPH